jgi:hypothetical protein
MECTYCGSIEELVWWRNHYLCNSCYQERKDEDVEEFFMKQLTKK